jgi:hypothetical protein
MDGLGDADAADMNRGPPDLRIPVAGKIAASDPVAGPGDRVDDAARRMADAVRQDDQPDELTSEVSQRILPERSSV